MPATKHKYTREERLILTILFCNWLEDILEDGPAIVKMMEDLEASAELYNRLLRAAGGGKRSETQR